jgi:hypothetical protein
MGDLKYDARALHNEPVTETEKEIARQELANEELLIAPLDASICTAESHVQACQKEADAIHQMLDIALSKLAISKRSYERLIRTRHIIDDSIHYNRSYFHPQRKVPAEVLIPIFRALVEQTETERGRLMRQGQGQGVKCTSNPLKSAYRLSLVCRKWRRVARSDPSLWRYIPADIHSPDEVEYIKQAVSLAKGAGIVVSATRTDPTCWADSTWEALQVLPPRVSQVEVIVECQGYISSINWPVECIVDKWINFLRPGVQYAAVGVPGDSIENVPKSIEYYNLNALLDSADAAWMHATTVTVHWTSDVPVTPESLVSLFQRTPHLHTLYLDWSSWADAPPAPTAPFAVANLQRLRLNIFSIVEAYKVLQDIVQLSSLSSLWFDFPTDRDHRVEPLPVAAWKTFVDFNRTASATFSIHSLVISSLRPVVEEEDKAHFAQLLDILAEMPGVHSLILKDSNAEILFHVMLDDVRIPPLLPALTDLTLKRCRIRGETLLRWVKRRMPSNDPMTLSNSSIGTTRPSSSTMTATKPLDQVRFEDCPGISNKEWNQLSEIVNSSKTLK